MLSSYFASLFIISDYYQTDARDLFQRAIKVSVYSIWIPYIRVELKAKSNGGKNLDHLDFTISVSLVAFSLYRNNVHIPTQTLYFNLTIYRPVNIQN